jgi:DNA-binding transcriptional LysR family regulator
MVNEIPLKYLYESARQGTMRAASEKLDVATSSISRQIKGFEKDLGIPLIERNCRGIKLTEAGQLAYTFYRERQAHDEVFLSRIGDLRSIRSGKIDLAVGEAFITDGFSMLLQQFMQNSPGVFVSVKVSGTNSSVALVRDDEAHFGLIFDTPRDPKVKARSAILQPLHVTAHPDHEICRKKVLRLEELNQFSIGLPEESFRIRQIIHLAEHEQGTFIEPSLVTNSMTLLKDFAKYGRGLTILPDFLAQPELSQGKLCAVPTNSSILNSTHISLITRVGRQLSPSAYQLLIAVEGYLKKSFSSNR